MPRTTIRVLLALFLFPVVLVALLAAGLPPAATTTYRLDSNDNLEIINTRAQIVTYRGRRRSTSPLRTQTLTRITAP